MSTVTYRCPNCGGPLLFDPQKQQFHCEYCLSNFTNHQLDAGNDSPTDPIDHWSDPLPHTKDEAFRQRAVLYTCPSCGAEVICDENTAATFCYYCHSSVILSGRLSGKWQPTKVLPFAISQEEATEKFLQWCSKKHFLPRKFVKPKQIKKLTGIYLPYWLLDCRLHGSLTARATRSRSWHSGNKYYTETQEYHLSRSGELSFRHLFKLGLKHSDKDLLEAIHPYDYSDLQDFSMAYLSGFQAEKYDLERDAIRPELQKDVQRYTEKRLKETITGYDTVSPEHCDIQLQEANWQYALLPVWLLTYHHKKKTYIFALNGQNGRIYGSLPISYSKLILFFYGFSTAIGLLYTIWGLII